MSLSGDPASAYPLEWPLGWRRTPAAKRKQGRFTKLGHGEYKIQRPLTVGDGVERVIDELSRMGVARRDVIISTNVRTRLDGLPRSGERLPDDPGAAVYWRRNKISSVIAIDMYTSVADNLAAIAATLDAMRAIARHGSAEVMERTFTGFIALPPPATGWRAVLGSCTTLDEARAAYRRLASINHPDRRGGDDAAMKKVNAAWEQAQKELQA